MPIVRFAPVADRRLQTEQLHKSPHRRTVMKSSEHAKLFSFGRTARNALHVNSLVAEISRAIFINLYMISQKCGTI